jgi:hypothetical protein
MGHLLSAHSLLLREMERYAEADELDDKALDITRLWLQEASPLAMLREEYAIMQRKYLRKGEAVIYNGIHMPVEEYLTLQADRSEDEESESLQRSQERLSQNFRARLLEQVDSRNG